MFKATIESISHEGGLMAPFSGSSPALGSVIVNSADGMYIGKIDAVLGNLQSPIAHIAHLDRKIDPNTLTGLEIIIRPKSERLPRETNSRQKPERRQHRESWSERGRIDNRRDNRERNYSKDRRDNRERNNSRDRSNNDWICNKCNNSNFGFRTECNRCGNKKDSNSGTRRGRDDSRRRGNDRRNQPRDNRARDNKTFNDNDWECPKCNNSNFSFRKECNRCGEPRSSNTRGRDNSRNRDGNFRKGDGKRNHASKPREVRQFRKSRGKGPGHAHNRGPKPLDSRPRRRNRDD